MYIQRGSENNPWAMQAPHDIPAGAMPPIPTPLPDLLRVEFVPEPSAPVRLVPVRYDKMMYKSTVWMTEMTRGGFTGSFPDREKKATMTADGFAVDAPRKTRDMTIASFRGIAVSQFRHLTSFPSWTLTSQCCQAYLLSRNLTHLLFRKCYWMSYQWVFATHLALALLWWIIAHAWRPFRPILSAGSHRTTSLQGWPGWSWWMCRVKCRSRYVGSRRWKIYELTISAQDFSRKALHSTASTILHSWDTCMRLQCSQWMFCRFATLSSSGFKT